MKKACCFIGRRGMEHVIAEGWLVKVEVPCVHYLVENKIAQYCTHVLSSALTPMPLTILPAK
jgi:hypothetical protein